MCSAASTSASATAIAHTAQIHSHQNYCEALQAKISFFFFCCCFVWLGQKTNVKWRFWTWANKIMTLFLSYVKMNTKHMTRIHSERWLNDYYYYTYSKFKLNSIDIRHRLINHIIEIVLHHHEFIHSIFSDHGWRKTYMCASKPLPGGHWLMSAHFIIFIIIIFHFNLGIKSLSWSSCSVFGVQLTYLTSTAGDLHTRLIFDIILR